jgi:tellurite methyltransferase
MERASGNSLANMYDKLYRESEAVFGNGKPAVFVLEAATYIPAGGRVVEYGAGQGRNALALAERGLSVQAIDLSPVGVRFMDEQAQMRGLHNFHAEVSDAKGALEGEYDLIVSTFMLHHLSNEAAMDFIHKIKEHTKEGGIHALSVFLEGGDFAHDDHSHFYPVSQELKQLYEDWEILSYSERQSLAKQTRPDGSCMANQMAEIIARKSS